MKNISKTILALMLAVAIVMSFAACSSNSGDNAEETTPVSTAETSEEAVDEGNDGQNPVMNFIGNYENGLAKILVEAEGTDGAKFTVDLGLTDDEAEQYTFSGTIDPDTLKVTYSNSTKKILTLDANRNVTGETVEYTDGDGVIIFHEDGTLEWQDENEATRVEGNTVFTYVTAE
ncbi:MAG: hypothetical protein IJ643_06280 [Eubacterium sp.]|nr:hypothetical protein [Eubacterium sp.]